MIVATKKQPWRLKLVSECVMGNRIFTWSKTISQDIFLATKGRMNSNLRMADQG